MPDRPLRKLRRPGPVLRPDEIDGVIRHVRDSVSAASDALREATQVGAGDLEHADLPDLTDLDDVSSVALRAWLEDETIALVEPEGDRGILAHEFHHETLKKALVSLKAQVLTEIAQGKGLRPARGLDELAQQVAASYDWDEEAIAQLIIDHAETPAETEGGLTTRIFSLREAADLEYIADRLAYVNGRYYRTDIAKWFVFERFSVHGTLLRAEGSVQAYRAHVSHEDSFKLATSRDTYSAEIELEEGSSIARVNLAKTQVVARSMMAALRVAARADRKEYVPNAGSDAEIQRRRLHPNTLFLLDLAMHGLDGHLFRDRNVVLARFKYSRGGVDVADAQESRKRKPAIRAVRLEGEDLLDSPTACQLMWNEGRPLVDLTIDVLSEESAADTRPKGRIPIRVSLERDHVHVSTGLVHDVKWMREVHESVVASVQKSINAAVPLERSERIEALVQSQAEAPDAEVEARLLGDSLEKI